ncbi:hypothetical protein ABG768_004969 [Culter alburnus]|uniref:Uncharacterized protein n=1 Tax=Culter alburnus TaxID=194366 RepID=A0AAW2A091_CULAL
MTERRLLPPDDDQGSLLSRLGTDSPKPRVKFGGMFCNIEGAYENKTLNFESYSPSSARRNPRGRVDDQRDNFSDTSSVSDFTSVSQTPPNRTQPTPSCSSQGQTLVYPTGPSRVHNGRRESAGWGVNAKAADGEQTQTEGGGSGGLLSTVTIEPR